MRCYMFLFFFSLVGASLESKREFSQDKVKDVIDCNKTGCLIKRLLPQFDISSTNQNTQLVTAII